MLAFLNNSEIYTDDQKKIMILRTARIHSSHKTKAQGKNGSFRHGQSTGQSEWSKLLKLFSFLGDNDIIIL